MTPLTAIRFTTRDLAAVRRLQTVFGVSTMAAAVRAAMYETLERRAKETPTPRRRRAA